MLLGIGRKTLYNSFIELLEQYLESDMHISEDQVVPHARHKHESSALFRENIAQQMQVKGVQDPLLTLNFVNLFNLDDFSTESISMYQDDDDSK